MSLFRALLLWALMLAVPFQGYAAASMVGCAPGLSPGVVALAMAPTADMASDDHHAHGQHADHAADATATPDLHAHAAADGDAPHKCGICGMCHAVALVGVPLACALGDLPPADLAGSAHPVATRAPPVLDKPPRA